MVDKFENDKAVDEVIAEESFNDGDCCCSKEYSLIEKVGVEFIGAFFVAFVPIFISTFGNIKLQTSFVLILALATGLTYGALYSAFGKVSGGHFNPAITVASIIKKTTSGIDGAAFIIAQVIGGIIAGGIVKIILPSETSQVFKGETDVVLLHNFGANAVYPNTGDSMFAKLAGQEDTYVHFSLAGAIILELLAIVLITIAYLKVSKKPGIGALAIGGAYTVGTFITFLATNAALNPVRSIGSAIFANDWSIGIDYPISDLWVFVVVPVAGAALTVLIYQIVKDLVNRSNDLEYIDESTLIDDEPTEEVREWVTGFGDNKTRTIRL
jgi:aquaporin Z